MFPGVPRTALAAAPWKGFPVNPRAAWCRLTLQTPTPDKPAKNDCRHRGAPAKTPGGRLSTEGKGGDEGKLPQETACVGYCTRVAQTEAGTGTWELSNCSLCSYTSGTSEKCRRNNARENLPNHKLRRIRKLFTWIPPSLCSSLRWNLVILINLLFVPGKHLFSVSKIPSSGIRGLVRALCARPQPHGQTHGSGRHDSCFAIHFSLPVTWPNEKKFSGWERCYHRGQTDRESPAGSGHAEF